jgi:uncharacterized protein
LKNRYRIISVRRDVKREARPAPIWRSKNNDGATVLRNAAFLCREEIVGALLVKGAGTEVRNKYGAAPLDSVTVPFEAVKPVYDILMHFLGPLGLELDCDRIRRERPKIAAILREDQEPRTPD